VTQTEGAAAPPPADDGSPVGPTRRAIWRDREDRRPGLPPGSNVAAIVRAGLVGLVLGFLGGLVVFFVGSSRGLNAPGFESIVIVLGGLTLVIALVVGLARAAFWSIEGVVAIALFFFGAINGYGNGLRIVPGNTTDGTLLATVPGDLAEKSSPVSGTATCRWTDRSVTVLTSRGSFTWSLTEQATITADIPAGSAMATVTSRVDGSSQTLAGTLGGLEAAGAQGVATFPAGAIVRWQCPALP
jgi:hypothetical protein